MPPAFVLSQDQTLRLDWFNGYKSVNIARLFNPCSLILFKISVYEIQQADFYKSQRTTRYHVPPPANLFQNASNFFKQRLPINTKLKGSNVGRSGSTRAGYMQVSTTCPPLKCDFFNFFVETPFFLDFLSENQPWMAFRTEFYALLHSKILFIADLSRQGERKTHKYAYL